jgi:1-deoxy-D-xylulose-5-phosphate reductoisomerase
MRHAIQYALTYPERHTCQLPSLDLTTVSGLHFEAPDHERFPSIRLAYRALREGGTLPAAMNAANEEAVAAFLNEQIGLTEIPQVIESVMNTHSNQPAKDIKTILDADHQARLAAIERISCHKEAQNAQKI